ncbi:Lysine ketoglutarate reductase trans-splicing related 1-like [Zostera marina]|uniref:Lysine ketoglutarate reductase trans-splicing related 1-like n=1 Tax=Zostera marina TaxID=29655 RepID=A0A0K9NVR3_ZOSMR|nr:Lysine ketoglutarate reductase trans-splicing related 1-like [Zostera marina]
MPLGSEPLPKGIVVQNSNLEMKPLWGSFKLMNNSKASKSLLAIAVGISQKEIVNEIVKKFISDDFTVMLLHYDGVVDEWRDLNWSDTVIHVSALNQTKWWFAKRFLHPDIVSEYNYIFLWDEDLNVEHFNPQRYLSIVKEKGLEISQPALDLTKSEVHHRITVRVKKKMHRRVYKHIGNGKCYENSTSPPCVGHHIFKVGLKLWLRCSLWHMIQNDLIHAWGLDMKLGYCAQGDRTKNVGVVDSEYLIHKGIPTLGGFGIRKSIRKASSKIADPVQKLNLTDSRTLVRIRSLEEFGMFRKRWQKAAEEDACWSDPFPRRITK